MSVDWRVGQEKKGRGRGVPVRPGLVRIYCDVMTCFHPGWSGWHMYLNLVTTLNKPLLCLVHSALYTLDRGLSMVAEHTDDTPD